MNNSKASKIQFRKYIKSLRKRGRKYALEAS